MSTFNALQDMDPAARAVAEVRAREAGMSLADWLEALVYEQGAPALGRRPVFFGGGPTLRSEKSSGYTAVAPAILSLGQYDLDTMPAAATHRYPEIEGGNHRRIFISYEAHEDTWSAVQMISAFPPRIDQAAILLSAAFAEADVAFRLPSQRTSARYKATSRWYHTLIDNCLHRSREVRNALVHQWAPSGRAERLWSDAFVTLCDLTPARRELLVLFHHDRGRASIELVKYLDIATQQFELSANLLAEVDAPAGGEISDEQRFKQLRATILERAGGGLSLTQAAERLGVTRQALHKRIKTGTVLGMMDGEELVLPKLQFVDVGKKSKALIGLSDVVRLFERAGGWSALQFLIETDPNLAAAPIEILRAGKVETVVAAARAYLGLDEG
ncbi:MAG: hypothetical protein ACRYG8_40545 [Janthinobacterium lividum]